jgi:hypothetical protein
MLGRTTKDRAMSSIYCLYATSDGRPQYIGQTTKAVEVRLDQHIRDAVRQPATPLLRWIRDTMERGFQVHAHALQRYVPPNDLDMFERYWISQFSDLLNDRRGRPRVQVATGIALTVERALQRRVSPSVASRP